MKRRTFVKMGALAAGSLLLGGYSGSETTSDASVLSEEEGTLETQPAPEMTGVPSFFNLTEGRNGIAPTVTLASGTTMPACGIGTYSLKDTTCADALLSAFSEGVRLVDTAYIYGNEEAVGTAIRTTPVPREEIFLITKLYPNQYAHAAESIDEALGRLGLDYVDMMLLHHPGTSDVEAYRAMEQAKEAGKIRTLGLSNYYIEEIETFMTQVATPPDLVQNEIHPYYQERSVVEHMLGRGIAMQAWYPLGGRGHNAELFTDTTLHAIASAHNVSVAQVMLRWNMQHGVIVIPGSSNPEHIQENISLFDFALTSDEMGAIDALERAEKHDWY